MRISYPGSGGSGVIFAVDLEKKQGYVVTNAHVAPDVRKSVSAISLDGTKYPGAMIYADSSVDLAIFAIWADEKTPWVPLATSYPERGQQIWQAGYPSNGSSQVFRKRYGQSLGLGGVSGKAHVCRLAFPVIPGDSGSPVFNEKGEVCAIVWGTTDRESMAVPVNYLHKLIQEKCQYICPPGGFRPGPPQIDGKYGPNQPPPLNPPLPGPQRPLQSSPELKDVQNSIAELRQLILKIEGKSGPQGPPGEKGAQGEKGASPDVSPLLQNSIAELRQLILKIEGKPGPDLSLLRFEIEKMRNDLKDLIKPGPPGPQGPKGDPGPQGAMGPQGPSADSLQAELKQLRAELDAMRNLRYIAELYDINGQLKQKAEFGKDQPLRLKLIPVK